MIVSKFKLKKLKKITKPIPEHKVIGLNTQGVFVCIVTLWFFKKLIFYVNVKNKFKKIKNIYYFNIFLSEIYFEIIFFIFNITTLKWNKKYKK